jgi:hypothetical protein
MEIFAWDEMDLIFITNIVSSTTYQPGCSPVVFQFSITLQRFKEISLFHMLLPSVILLGSVKCLQRFGQLYIDRISQSNK